MIAQTFKSALATTGAIAARSALALAVATVTIGVSIADADAKTKSKIYNNPKVGGRWLDLCYAQGSCRTQQAVNAYCRQRGYDKAGAYKYSKSKIGHKNARIGDNSTCLAIGRKCHRITKVQCYKTIAAPVPPKPGKGNDLGRDLAIGAIGAIIGGIAVGAAKNQGGNGSGLSAQHIDWCYANFQSYKASTNTYTSNSGEQRVCNSPYN